ncbi:uncharacterized protein LOC121373429 isoform X2 [Gigantopelta aegis]|uniref:uncharacterized protein LOC121373429 isoform X2 n=1 Tax=Gigantopelta aegis TaxID=1735272 RepID=UPI001B88E5AD|nr:uncharacterized protein LOC121373429 isoform X2 [Gigantopelta aegis]
MGVRSYLRGPCRHIVIVAVLVCCVEIITNQNCPGYVPLTYVPCYTDYNVSSLDLYDLSSMDFYECAVNCANQIGCLFFLYDSRHDTCGSYRLNSANTNVFPKGKYYLKYETEDDCGSSPKPEPECYLVSKEYAGRKMTTQSGMTCQR